MEEETSSSGIYVVFDHYMRMNDGRIEKVRDNVLFRGNIKQFKAMHQNFAIIGYHTVNEGEVSATATMMNEKLPPLPESVNNAPKAVITPELMQKAAEAANSPAVLPQQQTVQQPQAAQEPARPAEKVFKDGDSYIKMADGHVFKLSWVDYDDSKAPFDSRVRLSDGKIQVTSWVELAQ